MRRRALMHAASQGLRHGRSAWTGSALLAIAVHLLPALAAVPSLDHFFPAGVQPGSTNTVIAIGKFDPWPVQAWVDDPGIRFEAETNKGTFRVTVATNAAPGAHLVRLFNDEGSPKPRFLVVDTRPQTAETEPNDEFASPQVITNLPGVINGRLEKSGDVDSYAVNLSAGQTLVASLDAYVLGSPLDALLRLTDARGVQLAWNHDDGRSLDPRLVFTAPGSGRYVIQVMGFPHPATSEIRLHGSAACVYRLHLHGGSYVSHTLPLGVRRDACTALRVAAWNRGAAGPPGEFTFDPKSLPPDAAMALVQIPGAENTLQIPVDDGPELIESEPNNLASNANAFAEIPVTVSGCIESGKDEDRFAFPAKKDEKLRFEVVGAELGFPLDSWLKIENASGKEVARNDDSGGPDPKLDWTPGADGRFFAVIGSLLHRGGSNHLYRLAIRRLTPDVQATSAEHAIVVKPGTTNSFKFTVNRLHGHTNPLTAAAIELPDGIVAEPVEVPVKGGEVTLKLVAATNAPPARGPFAVEVTGADLKRRAEFLFSSRSENNGVPGGFQTLVINATDRLWLTVPPVVEAATNKPPAAATGK